jgi:hypothetical protein
LSAPHRDAPILKRRVTRREAAGTFQDLKRADQHASGRRPFAKRDDHQPSGERARHLMSARLIFDVHAVIGGNGLSGNIGVNGSPATMTRTGIG